MWDTHVKDMGWAVLGSPFWSPTQKVTNNMKITNTMCHFKSGMNTENRIPCPLPSIEEKVNIFSFLVSFQRVSKCFYLEFLYLCLIKHREDIGGVAVSACTTTLPRLGCRHCAGCMRLKHTKKKIDYRQSWNSFPWILEVISNEVWLACGFHVTGTKFI